MNSRFAGDMAMIPNLQRHLLFNPNANGRNAQHPFSHCLSTLSQLFSPPSTAAAAAAAADDNDAKLPDAAKPKLSSRKKALALAELIKFQPWSPQTESSLSALAGPSLSETTVIHSIRLLKTPRKALKFFVWAEQKGFALTSQCYFRMLELLGTERNLNTARNFLFSIPKRSNGAVPLEARFFNSLIKNYAVAGLFQESLKLFTSMKVIGISPSVVTFNTLFSILMKRGRTGMVYELFDEMLKTFGVKPDLYTFNILIRGCCMNSMVDQGFRFFKEMEKHECEPDVITYNTIVDGLCRAGKVEIAHNVVKGMLKKGSDLSPNVVTYTTLVRGYCEKQKVEEALNVFKEMVDRGPEPNSVTYNTLIQGLLEARKFDKVKELFKGAGEDGRFVPDTCTFNTLIHTHCSDGNLKAALEAFEKMSILNAAPDSATYSILIRCLCQKGDFEMAEKFFDELFKTGTLLSDAGCRPVVAAYNPMFKYLCENGKTKKAEKVFRQLMRMGVQDPLTFKTLIMGNRNEGMSEDGHELLVWMLRRNFVPDFETYESLLEGLLQEGKPRLAYDTLERMLKSSHLPRTFVFHSILTELVKQNCALECADLVVLMLVKKIRQNINLSTDTVRILFKAGLKERAFEILGCLYDNGYLVNMQELIVFLSQGKKLSEARDLLLFSLKNSQSVCIEICSTVLSALCKACRAQEAFELYYELVERQIELPLNCLEDLRLRLEVEGRSKEAEFVAKRMPRLEGALDYIGPRIT
ncbi:PREDICTED: pentatricopeptide repeat-containing protein At1g02060, chloroplastic isoform X2 [Ipomoea nil]|uniref:pentatricopeptide repeat-containing protein At1g02060, chloroplastic isoform X2 n=1 Tax=Ipomoea nil TaxID=35883 RepID=UPI000900E4C3|nr:PREDICTED: pentatricopeptide repeat-containing protein At1g02060, chloroplastic isoform X2 [Ipomoea nil]